MKGAEAQAKKYFPEGQIVSAPQSSTFATMSMNVVTRKADIAIAEPAFVNALVAYLNEKHPYDVPMILAWPVGAAPDYVNWVQEQVG